MRRMREDHLRSGREDGGKPFSFSAFRKRRPSKVQSGSHPFQSGFGKPFRNDRIRLQWYPCPATAHAMGAARRDPRRGEIPGADCQIWFCNAAHTPGGVVSNTGGNIDLRNHGEGSVLLQEALRSCGIKHQRKSWLISMGSKRRGERCYDNTKC